MNTVTVNLETLQKLLAYIGPDEARDFDECVANDWTDDELQHHAYMLVQDLQNCIDANQGAAK
jgi:hypothetical protein